MKRLRPITAGMIIIGLMAVLFNTSMLSYSQSHNHDKHAMLMEMLNDSVMMDLMMDHIVSDNRRLKLITEKMIYYTVGDTPKMDIIGNLLLSDQAIMTMLMNKWNDTTLFHKNVQHVIKKE